MKEILFLLMLFISIKGMPQKDSLKTWTPPQSPLQANRGALDTNSYKIQAAVLTAKLGALESIIANNQAIIIAQQKQLDKNLIELNNCEAISSKHEKELVKLKKQSLPLKIALVIVTGFATYRLLR